jgi:hypothetical protein
MSALTAESRSPSTPKTPAADANASDTGAPPLPAPCNVPAALVMVIISLINASNRMGVTTRMHGGDHQPGQFG